VSTELQKNDSNQLMRSGLANIVLKPNQLILVQPTTGIEGSIAGTFLDTVSGKTFSEINLSILTCNENRVLFETDDLNSPVTCKSMDGIVPITGPLADQYSLSPQSDLCSTCRHSSWADFRTKGIKPRCKQKYQMLFIDTEDELPYRLSVSGMSIKPFNSFITTIARDMVSVSRKSGETYNLYDYVTTISAVKNYGRKGNYYTIKFSPPEKLSQRGKYESVFNQYVYKPKTNVEPAFSPNYNEDLESFDSKFERVEV